MTVTDVRTTVLEALTEVAPEVDPDEVQGEIPLQEQLDLDSMDFLSVLEAVSEKTGVEVPEKDYGQVATLDDLVAYVEARR